MIRLLSLLAAAAFAGVRVVPEASRVVGLGGSPAVLVAPAGVPAALGGDGALPSAQILPQGFDALAPIGAVAAVSDPGPSLLEVAAPPTPLAAAPLSAQQAPPQSVFTFTLPGQAAGP
ncbi:MAG TPA: hypothetical protein VNI01_02345, partial [Elusimicrobiota bacterium]|nr:hypothetical protein [Elusimicrobiota bacterium]